MGGRKGTDMTRNIAWVKRAKKIADQMNKDGVCYVAVLGQPSQLRLERPTLTQRREPDCAQRQRRSGHGFPTILRLVEPGDPSRSEIPRYRIRADEKICNPEKLGKTLFPPFQN
jgi:hypothetical protein